MGSPPFPCRCPAHQAGSSISRVRARGPVRVYIRFSRFLRSRRKGGCLGLGQKRLGIERRRVKKQEV